MPRRAALALHLIIMSIKLQSSTTGVQNQAGLSTHSHSKPNSDPPRSQISKWRLDDLITLTTLPFRLILQPYILFPTCCIVILLVFIAHTPSLTYRLFSYLLTRLNVQLASYATLSLAPITHLYCTVLAGPFFCHKVVPISEIVNSLSTSATFASDIFESVASLGDPRNLEFHFGEIRELAFAIQYSTDLEGREALASQLLQLGHLTRDVKHQMIGLNSQGINAFSFISLEVGPSHPIHLSHLRLTLYHSSPGSKPLPKVSRAVTKNTPPIPYLTTLTDSSTISLTSYPSS